MYWQCNECGGVVDAAPKRAVCPECGTASLQILPSGGAAADPFELREYWVTIGMEQEHPLTDLAGR